MKSLFSILAVIFLVLVFCNAAFAEIFVKVKWIDDGDTVLLTDGRRIRYIGINAPEIAHADKSEEPYARQARAVNRRLVLSKKVRLEYDKVRTDSYGRTLAYLFLADGTFVNAQMLEKGAAHCLPIHPNTKYAVELISAQQRAMSAGLGLWRDWQENRAEYQGNRISKRFHRMTCPYGAKINPGNRVRFERRWDAFWAGYAPGKHCK